MRRPQQQSQDDADREYSSRDELWSTLYNDCADCNWASVSGGGDPLWQWPHHQKWWAHFFDTCRKLGRQTELHTSYYDVKHDPDIMLFPFERFDRVVYHLHHMDELDKIHRVGGEIVRVVFVVDDNMTEDEINKIAEYVEYSNEVDELTFRQRVDDHYKETYHLHGFLLAGHQKRWWYVTQCDYNTYFHNGKLYMKYTDIFEKE